MVSTARTRGNSGKRAVNEDWRLQVLVDLALCFKPNPVAAAFREQPSLPKFSLGQELIEVSAITQHYLLSLWRPIRTLVEAQLPDPSFTQSMANISLLPANQQQAAMGPYGPVSGYCTKAAFESSGGNCLRQCRFG